MAEPTDGTDTWADLADDIRRSRAAETAEVWQARAEKAELRVAQLEDLIRRAAHLIRDDRPVAALQSLEKAHA